MVGDWISNPETCVPRQLFYGLGVSRGDGYKRGSERSSLEHLHKCVSGDETEQSMTLALPRTDPLLTQKATAKHVLWSTGYVIETVPLKHYTVGLSSCVLSRNVTAFHLPSLSLHG